MTSDTPPYATQEGFSLIYENSSLLEIERMRNIPNDILRCLYCCNNIERCTCNKKILRDDNGIYLLAPEIDTEKYQQRKEDLRNVRVRTEEESRAVVRERRKGDFGFLSIRINLGLYVAGLIAFILWIALGPVPWGIVVLGLFSIWVADYVWYRTKRHKFLQSCLHSSPVIVSAEDWIIVSAKINSMPSIDDNVQLIRGFSSFDDFQHGNRYRMVGREIAREKSYSDEQSATFLEIGTNEGGLLRECNFIIHQAQWFFGLDIDYSQLQSFQPKADNVRLVMGDGQNLPFENEVFDIVVCSEVLEHFERPERGINEMARVIKPGGTVIITVPNALKIRNLNPLHILVDCIGGRSFDGLLQKKIMHPNMWVTATTHHWDFSKRDMEKLAATAGLSITHSYSCDLPFPYTGPLKRKAVFRAVESLCRLPLVKYMGRDLFTVSKKQ